MAFAPPFHRLQTALRSGRAIHDLLRTESRRERLVADVHAATRFGAELHERRRRRHGEALLDGRSGRSRGRLVRRGAAADRHALRTPDGADPASEPRKRGEDRPRQEEPRSRGRLRMGVPLDRSRLHAARQSRRRAFRRRDDDRALPVGDLARLHHAGAGRLAGGAGDRTERRNRDLLAGDGHGRSEQPDREQRRAHGDRPALHERPGGADARGARGRRRTAARRGEGRRSGEIRVVVRHDGDHVHPAAPRRRIRQERDLQHGRNGLLRDFAG